MSANVRPMHSERAAKLIDELTFGGHSWDGAQEMLAQALADAELYGVRRAVNRIGPVIADAATVLADLTIEVDQ